MITSSLCRMARSLLGWSAEELARRAGVGTATVNRFEIDQVTPIASTLSSLQRALEAGGAVFGQSSDGSPGVWKRRFRPGDIVRLRHNSTFRLGLDDSEGWITAVEPHPPATGPTYRVWAEFPGGATLPGIFEYEFKLVTPATAEIEEVPVSRTQNDIESILQAHRSRLLAVHQQEAIQKRGQQEETYRRTAARSSWGSISQAGSIAELIMLTINAFGDEAARAGSPVLFRLPPQGDVFSVRFDLQESGQLLTRATLQFGLNDDGLVIASAVFPGRYRPLPPSRQVNQVDSAWVRGIAKLVWEAALS